MHVHFFKLDGERVASLSLLPLDSTRQQTTVAHYTNSFTTPARYKNCDVYAKHPAASISNKGNESIASIHCSPMMGNDTTSKDLLFGAVSWIIQVGN
jgi:hypothetical protein